jgi:hypothetical protein
MTPGQRSKHDALKRSAIEGMVTFMNYRPSIDPNYSQERVDRCEQIIDAYLAGLERIAVPASDAAILSQAKAAVLGLNALNQECGGVLIETDQREQICALMIVAANDAGLTIDGDFTEEWREWQRLAAAFLSCCQN